MSTPINLHSGFHRTAHKSFVHLLGGTNRDVIELPMNRVDANYSKRKGGHSVLKKRKRPTRKNSLYKGHIMKNFRERERKLHSANAQIGNAIQTALRCHVEPKIIFYKLIETGSLSTCESNGKKYPHLPLSTETIKKKFQLDETSVDDLVTVELGKFSNTILKRTLWYLEGLELTEDEIFTLFFRSALEYSNTITDSRREQATMTIDSLDLLLSKGGRIPIPV